MVRARKMLMDLLAADLRCVDAHAHLGNFAFDDPGDEALRHYEVPGDGFTDVLPWSRINNRPCLRCMHGYGLALWRAGRTDEARDVFERMLWLNPIDNQGIRFLRARLRAGGAWGDL